MDGILFLFLALITIITSVKIAYYANSMDNKSNINSSFIGGILLAGITSLPELVTCLTATFISNPYLAIGDIIGSNIFNIFILAVFDIIFIKKMFFNKISHRYIYVNALLIYIYVVLIDSFIHKESGILFNVGFPSIIIISFYFVYLFFLSNIKTKSEIKKVDNTVKNVKVKFTVTAIVLVIVSVGLIYSADHLALTNPRFSSSIIGAFLIGITTSLPEVVSVYTLIRINSFNLAFSNIIGSNMFNLLILAVADILFKTGSIYFFGDNQSLIISKVNLYASIIFFIYIMRQKSWCKITYIVPSIIVVLAYLYLWKFMMMG